MLLHEFMVAGSDHIVISLYNAQHRDIDHIETFILIHCMNIFLKGDVDAEE